MIRRRIFLLALVLVHHSSAFELVSTSGDVKHVKGSSSSLSCESDEEPDFCKFKTGDGQECLAAKDESKTCSFGGLISIEDSTCYLTIDEANQINSGAYSCFLTKDVVVVTGVVNVEVLTKTELVFKDVMAGEEVAKIPLDNHEIKCSAQGGDPAPVITASLVDQEGNVVEELTEISMESDYADYGDSSAQSSSFAFVPHKENCGMFIRCEAKQGEDLEPVVIQKKIMIMYPPQPSGSPTQYEFEDGAVTTVGITFFASPVPETNRVIWHHSPSDIEQPPPPGAFVLTPGQSTEDGRFEAKELTINDHEVNAILKVKASQDDLLSGLWYLEAANEYGTTMYNFSFSRFELIKDPVNEPEDRKEEPSAQMGGGTIAAIVVVILGLILGVVITLWAKKQHKWCFNESGKPDHNDFNAVPQSDIVKNQEGGKKDDQAAKAKEDKMDNPV